MELLKTVRQGLSQRAQMYQRVVREERVVVNDPQDSAVRAKLKEEHPELYADTLASTFRNRLVALLKGDNGTYKLQREGSKLGWGGYSFYDPPELWGQTRETVYYYSRWVNFQNGLLSGEVQWR